MYTRTSPARRDAQPSGAVLSAVLSQQAVLARARRTTGRTRGRAPSATMICCLRTRASTTTSETGGEHPSVSSALGRGYPCGNPALLLPIARASLEEAWPMAAALVGADSAGEAIGTPAESAVQRRTACPVCYRRRRLVLSPAHAGDSTTRSGTAPSTRAVPVPVGQRGSHTASSTLTPGRAEQPHPGVRVPPFSVPRPPPSRPGGGNSPSCAERRPGRDRQAQPP